MGQKITIAFILGIFALFVVIAISVKALSGDIEGAVTDLANSQIPFWVGLPSGIIVIGVVLFLLFKEQIMDFINNFDLNSL